MVKQWETTKEKKQQEKNKERKGEEGGKKVLLFNYHSRFFCSCSSQSLLSAVCIFISSCSSLIHSSRRLTSACSNPLQCSRLEMAALHCWIAKSASDCQNKHVDKQSWCLKSTISQSGPISQVCSGKRRKFRGREGLKFYHKWAFCVWGIILQGYIFYCNTCFAFTSSIDSSSFSWKKGSNMQLINVKQIEVICTRLKRETQLLGFHFLSFHSNSNFVDTHWIIYP